MGISVKQGQVIIVGGGPVGLFSAIRLSGFGVPVVLIEQSDSVSSDIRASTFHPPTLEMMQPYGITDEAISRGLKVPEWQIRMHTTGEKAVFLMGCLSDKTAYPYRLQFEQSELCKIMDRIIRNDPLIKIHYGASLVSLQQIQGSVRIAVSKNGRISELEGELLIGADGGNSTVRGLLGITFDGSTYPEKTVLVTTPFAFHTHLNDISNVSYCWDDEGNFSLLRLRDKWRVSLYFPEGMTKEEALSQSFIEQRLQSICPSNNPYIIMDKRIYQVHQRIVERYDHGRIILAGDAAHLNSPTGGMGMNGGLHDAHNLTDKISKIWNGGDTSLLNLYSRQRRKVAKTAIIQQADRNRKRMTERDPAKRREHLNEMQNIACNHELMKSFLSKSSMFDGLETASQII